MRKGERPPSRYEMEKNAAFGDVDVLMRIESDIRRFAWGAVEKSPHLEADVQRIRKQITDAIQELKDMRLDALRVALDKHKGESNGR